MPFAVSGGGARIYPLHDDLFVDEFEAFPGPRGAVYVQSFDNLPSHAFKNDTAVTIIQWQDAFQFVGAFTGKFSFQVLLYADGAIYVSFPATAAGSLQSGRATIGIQNTDASIGLLYSGNSPNAINPPLGIAFTRTEPTIPLEILAFSVLDPMSGEASVTFESAPGTAYLIETSATLDFANPSTSLVIPSSEVTNTETTRLLTLAPEQDFLRIREIPES